MTYYRLHREDAPEFAASNAWSAGWGETFTADGSKYECRVCDGTSEDAGQPCWNCNGEGYFDADPGYSCCHTAEDLLAYFSQHCPTTDDEPIVVFEGDQVGNGLDGEPLVIPTEVIRWTTVGQLRAQAAN